MERTGLAGSSYSSFRRSFRVLKWARPGARGPPGPEDLRVPGQEDGGGPGALPSSARGVAAAARPRRCSEIPTPTSRASSSPRRCGWGAAAGARAEMEGDQGITCVPDSLICCAVADISIRQEDTMYK